MLALMLLGGVNVYARDVYATMASGTAVAQATWTGESSVYTYTWTDTGDSRNDYISLFGAFGGVENEELDWSEGVNFCFNVVDGLNDTPNALDVIITANGKDFSRAMYSNGTKTLTLTATSGDGFKKDDYYITAEDLKHVTDIRLQATNKFGQTLTTGSVKVSNVYVQISPKTTLTFNTAGIATIDLNDIDVTGDVTYNPATHVVTKTSGEGAFQINFNNADMRNVTQISLSAATTGTEGEITFSDILGPTSVYDNKNGSLVTWYSSKWNYSFSSYQTNAGQVSYIRFNVNSNGSMKINSITITANPLKLDTPNTPSLSTVGTWGTWSGVGADATLSSTGTPTWNINQSTGTVYGDVNVYNRNYADLQDYSTMQIYISNTSGNVRAMFNRAEDNSLFTISVNPSSGDFVDGSDYATYTEGILTIDLAKIKTDKGYVHLNAIKASAGASNAYVTKVTLTPLVLSPYDFALYGQYSAAIDLTALTNSSAKLVDCRSMSANNATLSTQNPNCIFIANEGALANTQNVCVNGTIASLVLQDGHPYASLANAAATVAKYSRTQPNKFGTLCLPFDVADTDVEYYTTNGVNGEGALMLTKLPEVTAGTPVIVYNPNHGTSHAYTLNNEDGSTLAVAGETDGTMKLVGAFKDETIDVTLDASNTYYGISNNEFVQATKTLNVKAFRAYLTTATSATPHDAKLRLQFSNEEATAIQTLAGEGNAVEAIYNASGVQQNGLQKGLNIVKMQNGKTVKVIVK